MYRLGVRRDFISQHALIGGDWGAENEPHSHHYIVEARLEGEALDQHGYLVDIVEVEAALADLCDRYRDHMLNELPEFKNLNPSLERLAHAFCEAIAQRVAATPLTAVEVLLWESDSAWASYRLERAR